MGCATQLLTGPRKGPTALRRYAPFAGYRGWNPRMRIDSSAVAHVRPFDPADRRVCDQAHGCAAECATEVDARRAMC